MIKYTCIDVIDRETFFVSRFEAKSTNPDSYIEGVINITSNSNDYVVGEEYTL